MQLQKDDMVIDVSRLYTITNYAKKLEISYNGVLMKIGSGKLNTIWISGTQFVIDKEEEE